MSRRTAHLTSIPFVLALCLLGAGAANATTYTVCPDGSGNFTAIQPALTAAAAADTVLLCDATYTGANNRGLSFDGHDIVLRSASGDPTACIIDCQQANRGIVFDTGESAATRVEGVTIQNGDATLFGGAGGAVYIDGAAPTFTNCRFVGNRTVTTWGGHGGAVSCSAGGPTFEDCVFYDNAAFDDGGAIFAIDTELTLTNCHFELSRCTDNHGGALSMMGSGFPLIHGCEFVNNTAGSWGGAISLFTSGGSIAYTTFVDNACATTGGGIYLAGTTLYVDYCTFDRDYAATGGGIYVEAGSHVDAGSSIISFSTGGGAVACGSGGSINLTCSDLYANVGGDYVGCATGQDTMNDNISADPIYCGVDNPAQPYTVRNDSPCAAGNTPGCGQIGAWGVGCSAPYSPFVVDQVLTGVMKSDAEWGDFDDDGDLDVALAGEDGTGYVTRTYENQGGTLVERAQTGLVGVIANFGGLAWGDYDNDGDLDLVVTGKTETAREARIYQNDGAGNLTHDAAQVLTAIGNASVTWIDHDNDGDLDLYAQGHDGAAAIATLYENDPPGTLTATASVLTNLMGGSADAADYDGDGDVDLVVTGLDGAQVRHTIFYENDPVGTLTSVGSKGITAVYFSDTAWGDYDNDGDADLLFTGNYAAGASNNVSRVYQNDGSGNLTLTATLQPRYYTSCAWGDYDNDGDLDAAISGRQGTLDYTDIYENDGGLFVLQDFGIQDVYRGSVTWVDVDNDADLDLFVTGEGTTGGHARLYDNEAMVANTAPTPPSSLQCGWDYDAARGDILRLSWSGASDAETASAGLYYAIRVGTTTGGHDVLSGTYASPLMGNTGLGEELELDVTNPTTVYWSVQTIDAGLMPSTWAPEESCEPPVPPEFVPGQTLVAVDRSQAAWGDFDGDGDLDLALTGESTANDTTLTYENQGGTLVHRAQVDLPGVQSPSAENLVWGDYDNDGDLDLAVAGVSNGQRIARIYENDGAGNLTWDAAQVLTAVSGPSLGWADYDNDGDLDLYVQGHDGASPVATLYENDPLGTLTADPAHTLVGIYAGSADWGDWNGDGDVDLLVTGVDGTYRWTVFYENDPVGTLTNTGNKGLLPLYLSDAAWGDCDNDGDLDLLYSGNHTPGALNNVTLVYENDGSGVFSQLASLSPCYYSSCAWGDYDNDEDLDIVLSGRHGTSYFVDIFDNEAGAFTARGLGFPQVHGGNVSWADVDGDGDLDVLVTGADDTQSYGQLYENLATRANNLPFAPTAMQYSWGYSPTRGDILQLSWSGASDAETSADGLYYCVRVGTAPGLHDVFSGTYGSPLFGNTGLGTTLDVYVRGGPTYYWSVQTVDAELAASGWSSEQSCAPPPYFAWAFRDTGVDGWGQRQWFEPPKWEPMDAVGALGYLPSWPIANREHDHFRDLDHENSYYACTEELTGDYSEFYFSAEIWLANNYPGSNPIDVRLRRGHWEDPGTSVASVLGGAITNEMPGQKYTFHFGQIPGLVLDGEALVIEIIYAGAPYDGHIYWDRQHTPSRLVARNKNVTAAEETPVVARLQLRPNYPNPFNPSTTIEYVVPGADQHVRLSVYDTAGRLVRRLVDEVQIAGRYKAVWNGTAQTGAPVASGVYYYEIVVGPARESRRMVLLK